MLLSFWKSLAVSSTVKDQFILRPSDLNPRNLSERNKTVCSHKDLHENVHCSFLPESREVEPVQVGISW